MFGKIVQLLGIPLKEGFEVLYGAEFDIYRNLRLDFAIISISNAPPIESRHYTYIHGGALIQKEYDGYKELLIWRKKEEEIKEEDVEDHLLVIIPYSATIETTAKRIAGRNPTEAVLEMHAGDTVRVNKIGAVPEVYMAVQAGNELFLVKKNR